MSAKWKRSDLELFFWTDNELMFSTHVWCFSAFVLDFKRLWKDAGTFVHYGHRNDRSSMTQLDLFCKTTTNRFRGSLVTGRYYYGVDVDMTCISTYPQGRLVRDSWKEKAMRLDIFNNNRMEIFFALVESIAMQ